MSDVVISVEGLGKKYRIKHQAERQRYVSLRDVLADRTKSVARRLWRLGRSQKSKIRGQTSDIRHPTSSRTEDFWALKDVSFEVKRGEVLGIIGRNGAGKSTLLKILSRITEPTEGRVRIKGRIASLLEVGTGFHPELTGRENIFLNGAILGMSRVEIKKKFDEIVAFAEIDKFLDTPVKRYSSGMYVRLAFAVAAHLEPEILIVDEVLAVGDAAFQKKCLGKMEEVAKGGRTVMFVSHNIAAVLQLTSSGVVLDGGRVIYRGPSISAVEKYTAGCVGSNSVEFNVEKTPRKYSGTGAAQLVLLKYARSLPIFHPYESFQFIAKIRTSEEIPKLRFSITIFGSDGGPVGSCFGPENVSLPANTVSEVQVELPCPSLAPGLYHCGLAIGKGDHKSDQTDFDVVLDTLGFEVRPAEGDGGTLSTWSRGWGAIVFSPLLQNVICKDFIHG